MEGIRKAWSITEIVCGGSGCTTTDYVGAAKTYYVYAQASDAGTGVNTVNPPPLKLRPGVKTDVSLR